MSKRDWLDVGLVVLAEDGAPALTIERLSGRLGVTKGSFYHHFKGMSGFKSDLLAHFEAVCATGYIDQVERGGGGAREKVERLIGMVLDDDIRPTLEPAIRAWAMQDAEVRAVQERVDQVRISYVRTVWAEFGGPATEAAAMANLLYLVLVGAGHVLPPVGSDDLREVYALTMRLAPDHPRET